MITSPQKIQDIARDLADKLKVRLENGSGVNTIRLAFDNNGAPELFLSVGGNEAEGEPVILVNIQQIDMVSKDIFGNSALAYSPSLSQVCYELDTHGKPIPSEQDLDTVKWELFPFGMRYQQVEIANATAVTAANAASATPSLDLDNLYWPNKGV